MTQFVWMMHRVTTEYPETGFRVRLGNSYQYSAPPSAPDERKFILKFPLLKYYLDSEGVIDKTVNVPLNMAALEEFYNNHKLHAIFDYPHPIYGMVPCKFNKPLKVPEGLENGDGALGSFELEFIECPGREASYV